MGQNLFILVVFSCLLVLASALPYGFPNYRSYQGGYGFGDIGGTYSSFPGYGGAFGAFPSYATAHHIHQYTQPYAYNGRGFLDNLLTGSTLPSLALGFLVGKAG